MMAASGETVEKKRPLDASFKAWDYTPTTTEQGQGQGQCQCHCQGTKKDDPNEVPTWDEFTQNTTFHGVRYIRYIQLYERHKTLVTGKEDVLMNSHTFRTTSTVKWKLYNFIDGVYSANNVSGKCQYQWRIQDFPEGRRPGDKNLLFDYFFPKTP